MCLMEFPNITLLSPNSFSHFGHPPLNEPIIVNEGVEKLTSTKHKLKVQLIEGNNIVHLI